MAETQTKCVVFKAATTAQQIQGIQFSINQLLVSCMLSSPCQSRCHTSCYIAQGMMYLVHHASLPA